VGCLGLARNPPSCKAARQRPVTMSFDNDYDYLVKLCAVGDSQVGKSSIIQRFANGIFPEFHGPTIGVDFFFRTVEMKGKQVKIQVWDTAGQERFQSITQSYYRGAHGIIFVYDLTDVVSAQSLSRWYEDVKKSARSDIKCIVVGNKADIKKSDDALDIATEFASRHRLAHVVVSAKTADNVSKAFLNLAEDCLGAETVNAGKGNSKIPVTLGKPVSSGGGCC